MRGTFQNIPEHKSLENSPDYARVFSGILVLVALSMSIISIADGSIVGNTDENLLWSVHSYSSALSQISGDGQYALIIEDYSQSQRLDKNGMNVASFYFSSDVGDVAVTPDLKTIAVGGRYNNGLNVRDGEGNYLFTKYNEQGPVAVAISPDGKVIVSVDKGYQERKIHYYDRAGTELWTLTVWTRDWKKSYSNDDYYKVPLIELSDDGRYIAASTGDNSLTLANKDGKKLWSVTCGGPVNNLAITKDGQYILAGSEDNKVYLFNNNGQQIWAYTTGGPVSGVAVSDDGQNFFAGSEDKKLYKLSLQGTPLWTYDTGSQIKSIAVSKNGQYCAAGTESGKIVQIKNDGSLVKAFNGKGAIRTLSLSDDGKYLLASGDYTSFFSKDPVTLPADPPLAVKAVDSLLWVTNYSGYTYPSFSDDGSAVAFGSKINRNQTVFLTSEGKQAWAYDVYSTVFAVSLSSDGQRLIFDDQPPYTSKNNDYSGLVQNIYYLNSKGEKLWSFPVNGYIVNMQLSKNGQKILAGVNKPGSSGSTNYIYYLDADGKLLWFKEFSSSIYQFWLSYDGQYIAINEPGRNEPGKIRFYDRAGNNFWTATYYGSNVLFSHDNKKIFISKDKNLESHTIDGSQLWTFTAGDYISSITLSPDENNLILGTHGNKVIMLNREGKELWSFPMGSKVGAVSFSNDGKSILVPSDDRNIYYLDTSGNLIRSFVVGSTVYDAKITSDNREIIAVTENSKIIAFANDDAASLNEKTKKIFSDYPSASFDTAKNEVNKAQQALVMNDTTLANLHAREAYRLASDIDQDGIPNKQDFAPTISNTWIFGFIAAIVVALMAGFIFDFRRCRVRPDISLKSSDVYEGEESTAEVNASVTGKFREMSCPVTLNKDSRGTLTSPGISLLSFGVLPIGKYIIAADCTVQQIRYGRKIASSTASFEVKPAIPEITIHVDPCECYEGDSATVSATLTNSSLFPALFPEFRLDPNQSRTIPFTLEPASPGILEKTEHLGYTNIARRAFSIDIPLWCTVKAIVPAIEIAVGTTECLEGEHPTATITIRNISSHDAIFDQFILKPAEERNLNVQLPAGNIGNNTEPHTVQFRNRLGKTFEKRIEISVMVKPAYPIITGSFKSPEVMEGDTCTIPITLNNTSEFEAIFPDFTIRPAGSKIIEIPANTRTPGDIRLTYMIVYKNSAAREFSREIPVSWHVTAREPAISASVAPLKECFEGDPLTAVIAIHNDAVHEAVFSDFVLKQGESRTVNVALSTSHTGENLVTYTLEFRNAVGRAFTKDILLPYTVLPIPRPSVILASDIREGFEGFIRIEVTNASVLALEQFRITLETPEDLQVKDKTVEMKQIGPGERRSISFKVFAPFGGDYSVKVKYSYNAAGRVFDHVLGGIVTVTSPDVSKAPSGSTQPTPAELKAMKARMPANPLVPSPSENAVAPLSSITEGAKCQVCLSEFSSAEPGAVKCPHCGNEFHYRCITKWVNKHGTCPICKKELKV